MSDLVTLLFRWALIRLRGCNNKIRVSRIEVHNDFGAQASLPPPGYAPVTHV